jgi:hypothetical protein
MPDGDNPGNVARFRELADRVDQPRIDAVDVERPVAGRRRRVAVVGSQLACNQLALRAPEADLGVGLADVDDDGPACGDGWQRGPPFQIAFD